MYKGIYLMWNFNFFFYTQCKGDYLPEGVAYAHLFFIILSMYWMMVSILSVTWGTKVGGKTFSAAISLKNSCSYLRETSAMLIPSWSIKNKYNIQLHKITLTLWDLYIKEKITFNITPPTPATPKKKKKTKQFQGEKCFSLRKLKIHNH